MPSNRNNGKRSPRKPLDTEVSMELEEFEYNFCKYVDAAMPRKFRDTYVKQILAALGEAARHTLKGLRHDAALFAGEKLYQFGEALSELDYVSTRLNRMNDMQTLSDATKAQLDMKLYDIKDGLERLSNSYRLRRDVVETIKESIYGDFYTFAEDYSKITLKTPYKRVTHFVRLNSDRKNKLKSKSWLKS